MSICSYMWESPVTYGRNIIVLCNQYNIVTAGFIVVIIWQQFGIISTYFVYSGCLKMICAVYH
jgi:hypothetical protein